MIHCYSVKKLSWVLGPAYRSLSNTTGHNHHIPTGDFDALILLTCCLCKCLVYIVLGLISLRLQAEKGDQCSELLYSEFCLRESLFYRLHWRVLEKWNNITVNCLKFYLWEFLFCHLFQGSEITVNRFYLWKSL